MDQGIRFEEIGNPNGLLFRLALHGRDPEHRQALAWGEGQVLIKGTPAWFGEDIDGTPAPFAWSWVDLLHFLGKHWPWLVHEESYPVVPGDNRLPETPLAYRDALSDHWSAISEEAMLEEDEEVFLFEERHDLARGMHGIFLPPLFILREGNQCWVCSPESGALLLPFDEVRTTLEQIGNHIAAFVRAHTDSEFGSRAEEALQWWESRQQRASEMLFTLQTGMPLDELVKLHGETPAASYFEIEDSQNPERTSLSSTLAAARMSAGVVPVPEQKALLEWVRTRELHSTERLDELSQEASGVPNPADKPHQQGYDLANWLRSKLGISHKERIDPEALLAEWGIEIDAWGNETGDEEYSAIPLHALAVWGGRHGPAILLNLQKTSFAYGIQGRRTTLAHEICHLLVDRNAALPAAEILGGKTPEHPEKRARAFAAELLLPRQAAYELVSASDDVNQSVRMLAEEFGVSKQVAAKQLLNSERSYEFNFNQRTIIKNLGRVYHDSDS